MSEDWLDPPANIIGDWSLGGVVYEPLAHVSTPSPTNESCSLYLKIYYKVYIQTILGPNKDHLPACH